MSRFIFSIMSVLAVMVMATSFTVLSVQEASAKPKFVKVCKNKRIAALSKWRKYKYSARVESRLLWDNKARKAFGTRYASWKISKRRYKNCWKNKKMTKWRCIRRGNPCTYKLNRGAH